MSSRVTAPATRRGTRVNSTSRKFRKAIHSMTADDENRQGTRLDEGPDHRMLCLDEPPGVPVTSGAIASNGGGEPTRM